MARDRGAYKRQQAQRRAALMKKMDQRRAVARERVKHRVTPEEILERRALEREEHPEKADALVAKLKTGVGSVFIAGAIIVGLVTVNGHQSSLAVQSQTQDRLTKTEAQIEAVTPVDVEKETADQQKFLETAQEKAVEVADLQQEFASLAYAQNTEKDPGNGAPTKGFTKMVEHRKALAPYFSPESYVVESDDQAYSLNSTYTFDADQIDPRYPWMLLYGKDSTESAPKYLDPKGATWTVASVAPSQVGDADAAEVVWTLKDGEGKLLALANAIYNKTQGFHSLTVNITTQGERLSTPAQNVLAKSTPKVPGVDDEKKGE